MVLGIEGKGLLPTSMIIFRRQGILRSSTLYTNKEYENLRIAITTSFNATIFYKTFLKSYIFFSRVLLDKFHYDFFLFFKEIHCL